MSEHPPGVIGISLGEIIREVAFVVCLQRTWRPEGTTTSFGQSISIPENMNTIIRAMKPEAQWLWIQADDQMWHPDALRWMLDLELDVVVPLIIRRGPPFMPVINTHRSRKNGYRPFEYADIPTDRLFEVFAAGSGGMLIRRHVLDAIKEQQGHDRVFEVDKGDKLSEDYVLCRKIRKAGFKIHCDPRIAMGHQGRFVIWPEVHEGRWRLRFDMGTNPNGEMATFHYDTAKQGS